MSRRVAIGVAAVATLMLAVTPVAVARTHYLRVIDSSDHIVATFFDAKCVKNKRGFFATTPQRVPSVAANTTY